MLAFEIIKEPVSVGMVNGARQKDVDEKRIFSIGRCSMEMIRSHFFMQINEESM